MSQIDSNYFINEPNEILSDCYVLILEMVGHYCNTFIDYMYRLHTFIDYMYTSLISTILYSMQQKPCSITEVNMNCRNAMRICNFLSENIIFFSPINLIISGTISKTC